MVGVSVLDMMGAGTVKSTGSSVYRILPPLAHQEPIRGSRFHQATKSQGHLVVGHTHLQREIGLKIRRDKLSMPLPVGEFANRLEQVNRREISRWIPRPVRRIGNSDGSIATRLTALSWIQLSFTPAHG